MKMTGLKTMGAILVGASFLTSSTQGLFASGIGSSTGLNIMNDATARATGLAGALGADENDISAFSYNPASLPSLQTTQIAFQHLNGLTDERLSQFSAGIPLTEGVLGASIFYYDGGNFELFDGGSTHSSVTAQKDYLLTVGYGTNNGPLDLGVAVKYYRSELLEMYSASTIVADFGAVRRLTPALRVATSLQNIGNYFRYEKDGEYLPRVARVSLAYKLGEGKTRPHMLYLDVPYLINEKRSELRIGGETMVGPLHARIGYRYGTDEVGGLSVGLGFDIGQAILDYAVDSNQEFDNTHKISVTYRFGLSKGEPEKNEVSLYKPVRYNYGIMK